MVAAPTSTIDMTLNSGEEIEIEERSPNELTLYQEHVLGPRDAKVWNPVFDITPASLITVLVTEKGVVKAPNSSKIEVLMKK